MIKVHYRKRLNGDVVMVEVSLEDMRTQMTQMHTDGNLVYICKYCIESLTYKGEFFKDTVVYCILYIC